MGMWAISSWERLVGTVTINIWVASDLFQNDVAKATFWASPCTQTYMFLLDSHRSRSDHLDHE